MNAQIPRPNSQCMPAPILLDAARRPRRREETLDPSRTGVDALHLERELRARVIGQEEAIGQIVNIYQMHITGLGAPNRPIGNLLFLGPTGSGKTRIVEAMAEALLGNARAMVKIDCAEFQHSHEIAKLIGSPPGYLGHRETHPLLSQETLNQHHTESLRLSFVLFDEIEKASDALWNLLLGILDKGTLTLGDNRKVDFAQTMIFMTSNLGAREMEAIAGPRLGFRPPPGAEPAAGVSGKMAKAGTEAARRKFTPEFMNRLDKVVVFQPLGEEELNRILDIELAYVQRRILTSPTANMFVFRTTAAAKRRLLEEGTDSRYGARHLKRAIERLVVQPLSNLIASRQVRAGDLIEVDCRPEAPGFSFVRSSEGLDLEAMELMLAPLAHPTPGVRAAHAAATAQPTRAGIRSSRRS